MPGKYKKYKQKSVLKVVNDGLVKLYKFDRVYNGKTYTERKGSFALELFGHKCVVCMSVQTNDKHWKDDKGREPIGFVNFAVCEDVNTSF